MATFEKRIGTGSVLGRDIDTVPSYTALSGTVTSNSTDTSVLNFVGPDDLLSLFDLPGVPPPTLTPNPFATAIAMHQDPQSSVWLYIPNSQIIARVIGIAQTAINHWALQMDRPVVSLIGAGCNSISGELLGYSWLNDGGGDGTLNGLTIPDGDNGGNPQLSTAADRLFFQEPVLIDATGTSFFVQENS